MMALLEAVRTEKVALEAWLVEEKSSFEQELTEASEERSALQLSLTQAWEESDMKEKELLEVVMMVKTALEHQMVADRDLQARTHQVYELHARLASSTVQPASSGVCVIKPYYRKRENQKILEKRQKVSSQVLEARAAASNAQTLLQNVANRKQKKQAERGGLVITEAVYGNLKGHSKSEEETTLGMDNELPLPILDVTIPLNFLVDDSGQLKLHEGIKKSGIMGFCDPCPGEPKQLKVSYTFGDHPYEVVVDDYGGLQLP